ncbi:hypothetical protein SK128_017325 [Halocaridina rubra]|uniref:Uncharacterized protein n=1 Tax=Halocaridina rubra TaxID=373956 RepID=A0AAN9A8Y9_HALRR
MTPVPSPTLRNSDMTTPATPMSLPRTVPNIFGHRENHRDAHRDVAKSLPRDYGASVRDLHAMFSSPTPGNASSNSISGFSAHRYHLGGSWDQLDSPRMPVAPLRASWDHLGPGWDKGIGEQGFENGTFTHGPDALLTHTLRPSHRHNASLPRSLGPQVGQEITPSPRLSKGEDEEDPGSRHVEVNDLASPRDSVAGAKGLLNAPGQNNCFLNSAVQYSSFHSGLPVGYMLVHSVENDRGNHENYTSWMKGRLIVQFLEGEGGGGISEISSARQPNDRIRARRGRGGTGRQKDNKIKEGKKDMRNKEGIVKGTEITSQKTVGIDCT